MHYFCPSCAQVMRLARITSRFDDLPDLYVFECRACGVSHIEATHKFLPPEVALVPMGVWASTERMQEELSLR